MKYLSHTTIVSALLLLPFTARAQDAQSFITAFTGFLNSTVITFLIGIGFLLYVINAIRFFVVEGHSEDGREKAKRLMYYGIGAMVLIIIFLGIINLLTGSSGFDTVTDAEIKPDYLP